MQEKEKEKKNITFFLTVRDFFAFSFEEKKTSFCAILLIPALEYHIE